MRRYTIGLIAALVFVVRPIEARALDYGRSLNDPELFGTTYRALACALFRRIVECIEGALLLTPQADGDGGGDGGGGGDGSDGGGSDSGGDSATGDGPSGNTGAVGDQGDQGDQGDAVAPAQSDPDSPTDPGSLAIDDPAQSLRGPGSPGSGGDIVRGASDSFIPPGAVIPTIGLDVTINAVIVSGAPTPWKAIGKSAGVHNVIVNGGIIALGDNPLAKPSSGGMVDPVDSFPSWLKFKPDLRYLDGSMFPPVVPNVIDIRTMSFSEEVIQNADN